MSLTLLRAYCSGTYGKLWGNKPKVASFVFGLFQTHFDLKQGLRDGLLQSDFSLRSTSDAHVALLGGDLDNARGRGPVFLLLLEESDRTPGPFSGF